MAHQEEFGTCGLWSDEVAMLKGQHERTREVMASVGGEGWSAGTIVEVTADLVGKRLLLSVAEITKSEDEDILTAQYSDVHLDCGSAEAALSALGGLRRGLYVSFDNNGALIGVVTGNLPD